MERESFCAPEIASMLNSSFIPIKVDRESRPDLDEIYMSFVTATTGSGGWPLNVFLTPDLQPVFGGTCWPGQSTSLPGSRRGSIEAEAPITFADVLAKMQNVWSSERVRCLESAHEITNQLKAFASEGGQQQYPPSESSEDEPVDLDLLDDALDHFITRFDFKYGGFTPSTPHGPKFANPPNLTFLLRIGASVAYPSTHTRFGFPAPVPGILGKESCVKAAAIALQTLLGISRSGMRDHLGLGFHRYSVTPDWNLPHFEKMMVDNALLLSCYCDAWALSKDPEILGTIYNLVEYFTSAQSAIVNPDGGWYASEDADSLPIATATSIHPTIPEKKEGAYYVWTLKDFESVLNERDAMILARHFGVKADGNVPAERDPQDELLNQNVLHIAMTPSLLAKEFGLPEDEIVKIIKSGRQALSEGRNTRRDKPAVDTKIITSWNGLAITALARASNTLADVDRERSKRCVDAAEKGLRFIQENMYDTSTGKLSRIFIPSQHDLANGTTSTANPQNSETNQAFLDDFAHLTLASLALYDLTFHQPYLTTAVKLQDYTIAHFSADTGGFYQAPVHSEDADQRILNLKPGSDTSLPSPNGLVAMNLWYLSGYLDTLSLDAHATNDTTGIPRTPNTISTPTKLSDKASSYIGFAKRTLGTFSIEMLQHPFLFVSLLSGLVIQEGLNGVRSLIVPRDMEEREVRKLRGWGRTVVRGDVDRVVRCLRDGDDGEGKASGLCRELRDGELDDVDFDE